eukprot:Selendium_serpulae@DN4913_c0_g1_i1.p1
MVGHHSPNTARSGSANQHRQRSCCNPYSVVRKGKRNILVSTYELYVLEVLGRPTDVYVIPWIVWAHVVGTFGFLVGSLFFCFPKHETIGLILFAVASGVDGAACCGMTWRAYQRKKWMTFAADLLLFISCIVFLVTNIPPLWFLYRIPIVWLWTIGSMMFVVGCGMLQAVLVQNLGLWGAFITVPLEMTNVIGSIFFTVGSVLLFYPPLKHLGTWNYVFGSAVFFVSSICSIIVCQLHAPSMRTYKLLYSSTKSFDLGSEDPGQTLNSGATTPALQGDSSEEPLMNQTETPQVGGVNTVSRKASRPVEAAS